MSGKVRGYGHFFFMQLEELKLLHSSSNYINVMCCVSRVFTKKSFAPSEFDLPSVPAA